MNDQLVLDIGANLSSFTQAISSARTKFDNLYKDLQNTSKRKNPFQGTAVAFAIEMKAIQKQSKDARKKIRDDMRAAGFSKKDSKQFARMYERQIDTAVSASRKIKGAYIRNKNDTIRTILKLEKAGNRHVRKVRLLALRKLGADELAQVEKTARAANAKRSSIGSRTSGNPSTSRSMLDSVGIVAKYGAISQALYGIQNAMRGTIAAVVDFDTMIQQNIGVLEIGRTEAIELAKEVHRLGIKYGEAFMDIQGAMLALGRAGVNSDQIKDYTKQVVALATITGDSLDDSAIALVRYMQVYQDEAEKVEQFAGRMAFLVNKTTLGMEDMKIIGNYALSAATSINLTYDSLIGLAGGFAKLGKQPSTIGTSIRRLGDISLATTDKMTTAWRKLGVDQGKLQADFVKGGKVAEQAVAGLIKQLGALKVENPERFQDALRGLNVRSKELLATLAQMGETGGDDLFGNFSDPENIINAVEQAEEVAQSFGKTWTSVTNTFKAAWTDSGISIMENLQPILKSLTVDGPNGALSFADAVKAMAVAMVSSLKIVIDGLTVLVASFALAYAGWQKLTGFATQHTAEYMKTDPTALANIENQISGLTRLEGRREEFQEKRLQSLKTEYIALKENDAVMEGWSKWGKEVRENGDKNVETIKNAVITMEKFTRAASEVDTSGIATTMDKASKSTKEMAKNGKIIVADVIAVKATEAQKLQLAKAELQQRMRINEVTPAAGRTESLKLELEYRDKIYKKAKEASEADVADQTKYNKFINTKMELETAANNVWQDGNRARKKASDDTDRATKKAGRDAERARKKAERDSERARKKAERDAKKGVAAAKKAQKDKEKLSKDAIKDLRLEAQIKQQIAKNEMLAKGQAPNKTQELKWAHELAVFKEQEALATWKAAEAQAVGADAIRDAAKAQLTYEKAVGDTLESIIDMQKETMDAISGGITDAFDAVLSGDIQDAWRGMFKTMLDTAVKSIAEVIAILIVQGKTAALTAIATAAATSTWVGMAAMAAAMAALGLFSGSVGGGGGSLSEKELAAAEGITGYENNAADDALDALLANSVTGLEYSSRMVASLQDLVRMSGKASMSLGDTLSGKDYNPNNKDGIWGGKFSELLSTGIDINPTSLKQLESGILNANTYTLEKVKKESWFGLKSKETTHKSTGEVDTGFVDAYTDAFMSGVDALREAANVLGVTDEQFAEFTASWEMISEQLNFEGMDAEGRAELIRGSLSAQMDSFAETLASLTDYVDNYQIMGESTSETIVRLANDFETVQSHVSTLGITLGAVSQASVGFTQSLRDIFDTMEEFSGFMTWFNNKFFTDEEKKQMAMQSLQTSFALYGETVPATTEGMKLLIQTSLQRLQTINGEIMGQQALVQAAAANMTAAIAAAGIGSAAALAAADALAQAEQILSDMEASADHLKGLIRAIRENIANIDIVFDSAQGVEDQRLADIDAATDAASKSADDMAKSCQDSADAAKQAADEAKQLQDSIHGLRVGWMDSMEAAQASMEYAKQESGLMGLTFDNFIGEFNKAVAMGQVNNENMEDWSSMSSALKSLEDAIKANTKVNEGGISVAEMRKTWGATGQDKAIYQANEAETGLYGLTVHNFLDKFNEAVSGGMTVELFAKWEQMSGALQAEREAEMDWLEKQKDFYENIISMIDDAYLGSLSYLNSMEKAQYAGEAAARALESGDSQTYIDKLGEQLEYEKAMSVTKEEYIPLFDAYIQELQNAEPEKDIGDAVTELETLNKKVDELQDIIEKAQFQGEL